MFRYEVGDIVGVAPAWYQAVLLELMTPYVHAFHHLIVGPYVPDEEDWVILESIGSGVRVGRLSWYRGQQVITYRPTRENVGQYAFYQGTLYGRRGYDYWGLVQLVVWGIPKWIKWGFKPIPWDCIPSDHNSALICTELVVEAYDKVDRLVPESIAATPAAIKAAQERGLLSIVFEGPVAAGIFQVKPSLFSRFIVPLSRRSKDLLPAFQVLRERVSGYTKAAFQAIRSIRAILR